MPSHALVGCANILTFLTVTTRGCRPLCWIILLTSLRLDGGINTTKGECNRSRVYNGRNQADIDSCV